MNKFQHLNLTLLVERPFEALKTSHFLASYSKIASIALQERCSLARRRKGKWKYIHVYIYIYILWKWKRSCMYIHSVYRVYMHAFHSTTYAIN